MKKLLLASILVPLLFTTVLAQKKGTDQQPTSAASFVDEYYKVQRANYKLALSIGDLGLAKQAVYGMLAVRPDEPHLMDTLSILYYNQGGYSQAVQLAEKILVTDAENTAVLEVAAASHKQLGNLKASLFNYEKLFKLQSQIDHLYQIATLQYALKRYGECENTLKQITQHPSKKNTVILAASADKAQNVPYEAAAVNMLGVIAVDLNQLEVATLYFNKALELMPDFVLAKENQKAVAQLNSSGK